MEPAAYLEAIGQKVKEEAGFIQQLFDEDQREGVRSQEGLTTFAIYRGIDH
jgi:hypothetical protein